MTSPSHMDAQASGQFARKLTAHLTAAEQQLPYVVVERLRASREQAVAQRKRAGSPLRHAAPVEETATLGIQNDGTLLLGAGRPTPSHVPVWVRRLLTGLPLAALAVALMVISVDQDTRATVDVAELDAAILTSDLPPAAYTDPGFLQFLQSPEPHTP